MLFRSRAKFEALGINVFFIGESRAWRWGREVLIECAENICDREDIVEANIRSVKISSPDVC